MTPPLPFTERQHRHLFIVAHVDDDGIGFGAGIQALPGVRIVYLTDSAPRDPRYFAQPCASREAYAALRHEEALRAAALLGVAQDRLHFLDAVDMESFRELERLEAALDRVCLDESPDVIWSPAYDGGHPDHDVAAFLATRIATRLRRPHFEFALYGSGNSIRPGEFTSGAPGFARRLSRVERERKAGVLAAYVSQSRILRRLAVDRERFRPAHRTDFHRRPSDRKTLYESWGWPVDADMLVEAFVAHDQRFPRPCEAGPASPSSTPSACA